MERLKVPLLNLLAIECHSTSELSAVLFTRHQSTKVCQALLMF